MNIYFHIDEFARDSIVASSLKKEFKNRGSRLIYGNRFTTKFILPLFYSSFDCIIVPRASFIKTNNSLNRTNVVVLPTESIGRINSSHEYILYNTFGEKFMLGDKSEYNFVTMFFLWGNLQKNIIDKILPQYSSKIFVVGHPRLDKNCTTITNAKTKSEKIKIGIVSRMTHSNSYDNRTILNHFKIVKNEKYIYYKNEQDNLPNSFFNGLPDYIYQELSDFNVYYNIILKLINNSNIEIYFKVHPRENVLVWSEFFKKEITKGNFFLTNWETPFVHWCQNLDYLVSTSSTSFYEALALNTKIICIDEIDTYKKFHDLEPSEKTFGLSKYMYLPESIAELEEIIYEKKNDLICNENGLKNQLISEINYPDCFSSTNQIIDLIERNIIPKTKYKPYFYELFSYIINNLIYMKRLITFRTESQSNNFLLTFKNKSYINNLIK